MNFSFVSANTPNCNNVQYSFSCREQNIFEIKKLQQIITGGDDQLTITSCKMVWIKKGKGIIKINEQAYSICDDTIYCVPPGKACQLIPVDDNIDGYTISFSRDFLQHKNTNEESTELLELFTTSTAMQVFSIAPNMKDELELTASILLTEYTGRFNRRNDILCKLLSIFIIYFTRHTEIKERHNEISSDGFLFRKFALLVKNNFISKKLVSDYAGELCITANYLNRTVKKVSGFSASYHIQQQVIAEAKKQAIYCGFNMKEIAYNLGFDNLAHFSKYFKKNTGTSFSSFRKDYSLATI